MKFQNKFKDYNLSQKENAKLDNLRRRMLLMGITIIEHEDLFCGGSISKEEPDLAMFRYKEENEVTYENASIRIGVLNIQSP